MSNLFPLTNIKILDLTRLLPGPFATQYLADLGADVLRVESPIPDLARLSPPFLHGRAGYDLATNRNKRSINLNLKSEKGKYIFYQLLQEYDIVIEQFRPGVSKRLGVDFDTLQQIKPDLIYCSLSGYGQHGPYSSKPAHDINYLSEAGFFHDQIMDKKEPPFVIPQTNVPDLAGGISAVIGILSAVISRQNTGRGQFIDVSIFDSIVHLLQGNAITVPLLNNSLDDEDYKFYPLNGKNPFYTTYKTKDEKYISVGALEPHFWRNLCQILEKNEYKDQQYNVTLFDEMRAAFQSKIITNDQDYWVQALSGACVAPVNQIDDLNKHEQLLGRKIINNVEIAKGKVYKTIYQPIIFSNSLEKRNKYPPPESGEHTREVLLGLGYTDEELETLLRNNVIF